MDSAIHRINLYPLDSAIGFPNTYPLDSGVPGGLRYPTFEKLMRGLEKGTQDHLNLLVIGIFICLQRQPRFVAAHPLFDFCMIDFNLTLKVYTARILMVGRINRTLAISINLTHAAH